MCERVAKCTQGDVPGKDQPRLRDFRGFTVVPVRPKGRPTTHALIRELSIDTNSVVATVTVRTDTVVKRVSVDWGDGKKDTVSTTPGGVAVFPPTQPLPPGTYRLHHAYAEPADRKPFDFFVLVRVDDASGPDFRIQKITLTPRYRVTNFRTSVALDSQCDSIFESSNEFDITQLVGGQPVNQWRWEPSNNIIPDTLFRLEGSLVSRELTVNDAEVDVFIDFIERDPLFDEHLGVNQSLHATQDSERIVRTIEDVDGGGCRVIVQWDRDVRLIVPLPPGPSLETADA